MKKQIIRVLGGLGAAVLAGGLYLIREIPSVEEIQMVGAILLRQSVTAYEDGQGGQRMVAEVLGGQQYFSFSESGQEEQERILAENKAESSAETSEATEDRVVGDVFQRDSEQTLQQSSGAAVPVRKSNAYVEKLRSTLDTQYLWNKFYIVDSTTSVTKDLFNVKTLLNMNLSLEKKKGKKQILIYHTHGASEYFSDSRNGKIEDSVVGVGTELTKELEKRGYGVYHDTTRYDLINGKLDRSLAYNKSLDGMQKIRKENPDIKVMIDLHRDSVGKGKHTYTTINGKKSAIVMFFNGMSRNKSGKIEYLYNPNLQANLAFSLQLKCKAMEYYDGFTKPIYLKGYRYNLHLEKRSLLIELGNENNTVEEAKNAAAPLADILDKVLSGKG